MSQMVFYGNQDTPDKITLCQDNDREGKTTEQKRYVSSNMGISWLKDNQTIANKDSPITAFNLRSNFASDHVLV